MSDITKTDFDLVDIKSVSAQYCVKNNCNLSINFHEHFFKRCLKPKRKILYMFLRIIYPSLFSLEDELVERIGRATSMKRVDIVISDYQLLCGFESNTYLNKLKRCLSMRKIKHILKDIVLD